MPERMRDHEVELIYELTDRLQERLSDAERIRARHTKAREANEWPDPRGVVARLVADGRPSGGH